MPRGAEQRGHDRRHHRGVEPVLRRQTGKRGERDALGQDDDRADEPSDGIGPQRCTVYAGPPAQERKQPAEPAGGTAYLSSLASPLPQVRFCPTGGITPESATRYLKLSNVITIGGSWMAPKTLVAAKDWAGIEALARQAASLKA